MSAGDRSTPVGDRRVTEVLGIGHPQNPAMTCKNRSRVTEGDRSSGGNHVQRAHAHGDSCCSSVTVGHPAVRS